MANRKKLSVSFCGWALLAFVLFLFASSYVLEAAGADRPASVGPASGEQTAQEAEALSPADCRQIISQLRQEQSLLLAEIGHVKREIAMLRMDSSKPGFREIFAGIGYIFGLAGVGLFVHSRKQSDRKD